MDSKVRIYLRHSVYPIELEGAGTDEHGNWTVTVTFKENYVWVRREWKHDNLQQALYTIPKCNLYYVDWGNWEDEKTTSNKEGCFA